MSDYDVDLFSWRYQDLIMARVDHPDANSLSLTFGNTVITMSMFGMLGALAGYAADKPDEEIAQSAAKALAVISDMDVGDELPDEQFEFLVSLHPHMAHMVFGEDLEMSTYLRSLMDCVISHGQEGQVVVEDNRYTEALEECGDYHFVDVTQDQHTGVYGLLSMHL